MGEQAIIERAGDRFSTGESLRVDLAALGVEPGMTLLVHSSLSALGWVCGGPVAAGQALETALGTQGTLVMPAHTSGNSDPAQWRRPPVPEAWWEPIRQTMPAYEADLTPTRQMGAIVECFRTQPGTQRSAHPQVSFAARGPGAAAILADHTLAAGLGDDSPLGRVRVRDGWVLLLGVGHGNNTSLHLAEHRARFPARRFVRNGAAMLVGGRREWVWFEELDYEDGDFPQIGADFARETGLVRQGAVGQGTALLFPQRALVDFAVRWIEAHRR